MLDLEKSPYILSRVSTSAINRFSTISAWSDGIISGEIVFSVDFPAVRRRETPCSFSSRIIRGERYILRLKKAHLSAVLVSFRCRVRFGATRFRAFRTLNWTLGPVQRTITATEPDLGPVQVQFRFASGSELDCGNTKHRRQRNFRVLLRQSPISLGGSTFSLLGTAEKEWVCVEGIALFDRVCPTYTALRSHTVCRVVEPCRNARGCGWCRREASEACQSSGALMV